MPFIYYYMKWNFFNLNKFLFFKNFVVIFKFFSIFLIYILYNNIYYNIFKELFLNEYFI